jgi:hypothetical protein
MKYITVQERDSSDYAEIIMKDFPNGGFTVWYDSDCFTKAYDVMRAYGVDETILGSREGIITPRFPKAFFDSLPGKADTLESYLKNNQGQSKVNPWSNSKLAQWGIGSPMLSPTSDTSGLSGQNKEGTDETSGTSYINKAKNDAWYVDMNSPTFVNEIAYFNPAFDWAVKPPAPMYLPSGELNTYGYDFINLPGMGNYFTDMYLNWVGTYLNSIGGGANGGYGLLLDEDRNGGGGW